MNAGMASLLKNKNFNEWRLFWLITGPISIAMVLAMLRTDLTTGEGVSSMISISVRCAVPWLYLAFAASSIQILFPGAFSLWLLRNRKIFGLCFAAAMAWQLFFILWLTTVHRDYYVSEVYALRDVIEGIIGYSFLIAMTLTSFRFGLKRLKPKQWKRLHKVGIYSLWIYAFSVYWWAMFYYADPRWIDPLYYWGGFLAWGLRIAAWRKKRVQLNSLNQPGGRSQPALVMLGGVVALIGVVVAATGLAWQGPAEALLTGYPTTRWAELYLPYWPFEPFFAVFIIMAGAYLTTLTRNPGAEQQPAVG